MSEPQNIFKLTGDLATCKANLEWFVQRCEVQEASVAELVEAAKMCLPLLEDWHEDDGRASPAWRRLSAAVKMVEAQEYTDEEDRRHQLEGASALLGALIWRVGGEVRLPNADLEHDYELEHTDLPDGMLVRARRIS